MKNLIEEYEMGNLSLDEAYFEALISWRNLSEDNEDYAKSKDQLFHLANLISKSYMKKQGYHYFEDGFSTIFNRGISAEQKKIFHEINGLIEEYACFVGADFDEIKNNLDLHDFLNLRDDAIYNIQCRETSGSLTAGKVVLTQKYKGNLEKDK